MFAKVFEQIFDSSIAEDYQVRLVFEDLLTLADIDGVVDKTHEAISRRTNVPIDIVRRSIAALESPDATSRRSNEEGRRIVRLDTHREWGWFIVNYEYYRNLASEEQRRSKTRDRVRKHREKAACNAPVTLSNDSPSSSPCSFPSSKEGDCKGGSRFPEFWRAWPAHVRKANKKACLTLWKANALDTNADAIVSAVGKFRACEDWTKDGGQYIPAPLVWLRQERWEAAGYIGNKTGVEDTPEIIEYAKQVRDRIERENGRDIGRLYHKIRDAIGQQALTRVKQLALEKGGRG